MHTIRHPPTKTQTPAPAQTRTGKIARLPRAIRDELIRRLDNGETAATLLPGSTNTPTSGKPSPLNSTPAPSMPKTSPTGETAAFQNWLRHEEDLDLTQSILDEADTLAATTIGEEEAEPDDYESSPAGLSAVAALALAKVIRSLSRGNLESPETQKALLNAIRTLNWLRQSDHRAIRLKMDLFRWEEEKAALQREADRRAAMAAVCKQPPPTESRIARPPAASHPPTVAWASCPPSPPAPQIISPPEQSGAAVPATPAPAPPSDDDDPLDPDAIAFLRRCAGVDHTPDEPLFLPDEST